MLEALVLIGGNLLGISLYYKNKKRSTKQHLHALMGSGSGPLAVSGDDIGKVNIITETDQKKEKTKEEIAAMRVLNSNIGSVVLLVASRAYPILTLPGMALAVYGCLPIYKRTYLSVFKERKLKNDLLNGLVVTGTDRKSVV